jgi:hypothetical protein
MAGHADSGGRRLASSTAAALPLRSFLSKADCKHRQGSMSRLREPALAVSPDPPDRRDLRRQVDHHTDRAGRHHARSPSSAQHRSTLMGSRGSG